MSELACLSVCWDHFRICDTMGCNKAKEVTCEQKQQCLSWKQLRRRKRNGSHVILTQQECVEIMNLVMARYDKVPHCKQKYLSEGRQCSG